MLFTPRTVCANSSLFNHPHPHARDLQARCPALCTMLQEGSSRAAAPPASRLDGSGAQSTALVELLLCGGKCQLKTAQQNVNLVLVPWKMTVAF